MEKETIEGFNPLEGEQVSSTKEYLINAIKYSRFSQENKDMIVSGVSGIEEGKFKEVLESLQKAIDMAMNLETVIINKLVRKNMPDSEITDEEIEKDVDRLGKIKERIEKLLSIKLDDETEQSE